MPNNRFFSSKYKPGTTKLRKHQILNSSLEKLTPPQGCNFFPPRPCGSLCDCCVSPLQFVLRQLIGQRVILATIADERDQPPRFFEFTIIAVNDFLVTVTNGSTTFVVNISDVIGVGFLPPERTINLLPPVNIGCECDCRERPIRQLLDTLINSTVNLLVSNGSTGANFTVQQTGLGIVLGTLLINDTLYRFAISTCKITAVGQS
ncbi:hypothetical protein SAMN05878482_102980 [Peribacillus simplex]|uniref:BclA protein n=1 Tax=Peribacillus simplex TaxID=1478 RepID=A0A9X8R8P7_9BACI|nr:hypothetical protein SAMN05878482_102980 [Peribacillus simplex]